MTIPAALAAALADLGIEVPCHEHPPLRTVADAHAIWDAMPGAQVKNLFLKDAGGQLWLAEEGEAPLGCIALRRIDAQRAEMKRLYVRPAARGLGLGRRLTAALLAEARRLGYRRICLDTLPVMRTAQALYEELGFVDIEPYRLNPVEGARFMALEI